MDCWEFKKCPTERKEKCIAYPNHGKDCWRGLGTLCGGSYQSSMRVKLKRCRSCDYLASVHSMKH
jgi:hypothetical protein